jgi:hypothetical protein
MRVWALLNLAVLAGVYWLAGPRGLAALLTAEFIAAALLSVVFLRTIATREAHEQASLRRIRARLFPHSCPLCGIVHGGVGQ